jgi:tetratricopeptide (TPR) repeat protein
MLGEIEAMPFGAGQIAATEQLLRRVDAEDAPELAFAARMLATTAYGYGGEPAKCFVTFSRCLAEFDRDPQPYHRRFSHQLLWQFKYMVSAMLKFPELPLDRTYAVLDDMERRYRESGHGLQAVHKHRYLVATHLGAADDAAEWYRRWVTAPRDSLSDCAGCDPTTQVEYLSRTGRYDEAVALAEPVLAGRLTCTEQPQAILTALLPAYRATGRADAARDAHREAYRRMRGRLSDLGEIADHVEFCTATGNEARALELVERHLDWLDRAPTPAAAMHFAATASAALRRVPAELTVHRRAAGDRPAAEVPVGVLADELAGTATALAARFDARNGTTHQSELVARRLAAGPVGEHLPLSASLRRPVRPRPPVDAGPTSTGSVPAGDGSAGVGAPAEVTVPAGATADELLELADDCWRTHRRAGLAAALRAYDERFGDTDQPPVTTARRLELRAAELDDDTDPDRAVEVGRAALAAWRAVPDEVRAQVVAGRLGALLCLTDAGAEEGLALARDSAAHLDGHGDQRERAAAHDRLALAYVHLQRWDEALAELDRAAAEADVDPWLAARVALHRTHVLEQLERAAEFHAAADRARTLSRAVGAAEMLTAACLAYARSVDDPAEAVAACDEALGHATGGTQLPLRVTRGRALLAADRAGEAVDDLAEAVTLCVEQGAPGDALLRWELANAYRAAGRLAEAAEVAEEAVLGLDRLGAQAEADGCRHLLAGIYEGLGETELALALLAQLAENLDGPDNLPHRAQVLEEAGGILYDADRDALAAQRFAAAAEAYRLAGARVDELRARRRELLALFWSGDLPAAVAAIERVDAVAAIFADLAEPPPVVTYERALAAEAVARVLIGEERHTAALDRLAGVPERLRSIEAFGEAAQVELLTGEVLLRDDRPADAERLLRGVLGGLPTGSRPATQAAWLLARALDDLDRSDEATKLRAEHGLDEE